MKNLFDTKDEFEKYLKENFEEEFKELIAAQLSESVSRENWNNENLIIQKRHDKKTSIQLFVAITATTINILILGLILYKLFW